MAIASPGSGHSFGLAVCGFGPAGCGVLLHALKAGALTELAQNGLVVIDRAKTPGVGKISSYKLTGNSLAQVFVDCIDDPDFGDLFEPLLRSHPAIAKLRAIHQDVPPLDLAGESLAIMATRFAAHLIEHYGITLLTETEIERIAKRTDDGYDIQIRDRHGAIRQIATDKIVAAFGGRQTVETAARCVVWPGMPLDRWRRKMLVSDAFLMMPDEAIRELIPSNAEHPFEVVVVGGSHSAFSAADRLAAALEPVGLRRILMLHRAPIRLFYPSAEAADADGYDFVDPDDVCPMSGRINRFGGLRYRAFDVARSVFRDGLVPDSQVTVDLVPMTTLAVRDHPTLLRRLDQAPIIVPALGYQANLPPLVGPDSEAIRLQNNPTGLNVDPTGRPLLLSGAPLADFHAFGLGSRLLTASVDIGGEPSFKGSADGVWLYQNQGAQMLLKGILGDRHGSLRATTNCRRYRSAAHV